MESPHSPHAPEPQRNTPFSAQTRFWGILLAAAVTLVIGSQLTRQWAGPPWLRMSVLMIPAVLALIAACACLFYLSRDLLVKPDPGSGTSGRPRGGLIREALYMGNPRWSIGFVLTSSVASSITALTGNSESPLWLRVLVALGPAIPLLMYLRSVFRDPAEVDELALLIRREAYGFAFWAMAGFVVCVHVFESAGVIPAFRWSAVQLVTLMVALLLVGAAVASRRFR